jgi:hypothetical protein
MLAALLAPGPASGCGTGLEASAERFTADQCVAALRAIGTMLAKPIAACAHGESAFAGTQCHLVLSQDPATDACLVAAILNTEAVPDPRCPRMLDEVALGDLAFFVLDDRHEGLWAAVVPPEAAGPAPVFDEWIEREGNRQSLQRRVIEFLAR